LNSDDDVALPSDATQQQTDITDSSAKTDNPTIADDVDVIRKRMGSKS